MNRLKIILIAFNYANHFSLANGYLKAYAERDPLIRDRVLIQILDFNTESHDIRQALYYLSKEKPDILGFSCYCWNMDKILPLARFVKQLYPKIRIVLGGPEVGPITQKYLTENPSLDVIVRGEGEETFQELLQTFLEKGRSLASVKGITYRENGRIMHNGDREPIGDLDQIPSPYLNGILSPRDEVTYIETYRGCPYKCAFCYEGKNFSTLRFFSEKRIRQEIELIMSHPEIRSFHVVDSVFNLNKERLKRLSAILRIANRFGTGLRTVEVMTESIDEESVELLKSANVLSIETGPQTVNQDTIVNINRFYDQERFKKGIALLRDGNIDVLVDLIIGLPGDNLFKFCRSLKAMIQLKPKRIIFSILHVLPGTDLYIHSERFGLKFDEKSPHVVLTNQTYPYEEIDKSVVMASSVDKEYQLQIRE